MRIVIDMNIEKLPSNNDAELNAKITGANSHGSSVIRILKRIPGVFIISKSSDLMTDDYFVEFDFKENRFRLETPFSDVFITSTCKDDVFDDFLGEFKFYSKSRLRRTIDKSLFSKNSKK